MSRYSHPAFRLFISVFLGLFLLAVVGPRPAASEELAPGHLLDVFGRQAWFVIKYNPFRDEYILGYSNGKAVIGHMDIAGNFFNQILIGQVNTGVTHMDLAYDSNRNQWLFVWRNGSPQTMFGRFLDTDGNPIGTEFSAGTGKGPRLAFSPTGDRFAMAFSVGGGSTKYKVISPDHTLVPPPAR